LQRQVGCKKLAESDTLVLRRLRYRAARLGSLELETWLEPVMDALITRPALQAEIERLLSLESPALEAIMHHSENIPPALRPWLEAPR